MAAEIKQKALHMHEGSYIAITVLSHGKTDQEYKGLYEYTMCDDFLECLVQNNTTQCCYLFAPKIDKTAPR
jgi:hypothetical protein